MKLEADVPTHGTLSFGGDVPEDLHAVLPLVVYDRDAGAVNEADAGTLSKACEVEEHRHGHEASGHDLHKAAVGEGPGKEMPPMYANAAEIVVLEVAVCVEVEAYQDGDDLGVRHHAFPPSPCGTVLSRKCVFFNFLIKFFAEIIRNTKNFTNFVFGNHDSVFIVGTSKLLKIIEITQQIGDFFSCRFNFFQLILIPNSRF